MSRHARRTCERPATRAGAQPRRGIGPRPGRPARPARPARRRRSTERLPRGASGTQPAGAPVSTAAARTAAAASGSGRADTHEDRGDAGTKTTQGRSQQDPSQPHTGSQPRAHRSGGSRARSRAGRHAAAGTPGGGAHRRVLHEPLTGRSARAAPAPVTRVGAGRADSIPAPRRAGGGPGSYASRDGAWHLHACALRFRSTRLTEGKVLASQSTSRGTDGRGIIKHG